MSSTIHSSCLMSCVTYEDMWHMKICDIIWMVDEMSHIMSVTWDSSRHICLDRCDVTYFLSADMRVDRRYVCRQKMCDITPILSMCVDRRYVTRVYLVYVCRHKCDVTYQKCDVTYQKCDVTAVEHIYMTQKICDTMPTSRGYVCRQNICDMYIPVHA